jgi:orotate phosphoribosyltransferase
MTASGEIGASIARLLFEAGAVKVSQERPFMLAAGWASPVYVDCRLLFGDPGLRRETLTVTAAAVSKLLATDAFDVIAGAETAGIPFASLLASELNLPLRYVRKRPLGIGRNAQVEGGSVEDMTALLVDDLTTDATSKSSFAKGLRSAGAVVHDVLSIFSYGIFPGTSERLTKAQLRLHAMATWDDVLRSEGGMRMRKADRQKIEEFLADPVLWSTRHGGRSAPQARPLP